MTFSIALQVGNIHRNIYRYLRCIEINEPSLHNYPVLPVCYVNVPHHNDDILMLLFNNNFM